MNATPKTDAAEMPVDEAAEHAGYNCYVVPAATCRKLETDLADCKAELATYVDAYEPAQLLIAKLRDDRAALIAALEAVEREAVTLRAFDKVPPLLSDSTRGIVRAVLARVRT